MGRRPHPVDQAKELADLAEAIYDAVEAHRRASLEIDRSIRHARRQGMKVQDLADLVGVHRETMGRMLGDETVVIVPSAR